MKNGPVLTAVLMVSTVAGATACSGVFGPVDVLHSRYANAQEAIEAGAIARGWLPSQLPASSVDIVEVHNIDTNEIWFKFGTDERDASLFVAGCERDAKARLPNRRRTRNAAPWWPDELLEGRRSSDPAWDIYLCSRMTHAGVASQALVAVSPSRRSVLYWMK